MLGNTRADEASHNTDAGIIPNAVNDLFDELQAKRDEANFGETWTVSLNFMEVYNEQVYDLLSSSGKVLAVREDSEKGIVVAAGITEQQVASANEVMNHLMEGNRNRKTEATAANAVSSRSHAVLQLLVKHVRRTESGREMITESKLSMVTFFRAFFFCVV